ncbi:MAG: SurA N-terminal domain-containing protein [Candidatus Omnitrophota bacterium]|nr:SurA N-terminal domain-containing protein [Candidatus Omnitrophota bacterium]
MFHASRFIFRRATCSLWRAAICAIIFLFAFSVSSFAQDKIIAIVNKDIITQKELNDFINFMRLQLATQYRGEQLESKIQSMKLDLLEKLIEDSLILQEAKKDNIRTDPDRIKARVNEIKKHYGSDSEFEDSLAKQGLVQADIEAKIREQLLMYTVIDIEIKRKIIIKPGEVTDFYQENSGKFILTEQREFESIAVDNESLANDVFAQLKSGQELQEVANKNSLTVNKFSCVRGGQLRKDIEDVVFKINLAEISAPVKIEGNYYIFKLNNIISTRQQTLPEVQDEIHAMLFNKKMQEALTNWLDELKGRSYIKILQS